MIKQMETYEEDIEYSQQEKPKKKTKKPKKTKKKSTLKRFIGFIIKLAVIAIAIWLIITYVFGIFFLKSDNMYPALKANDLCVTYKLDDYYKNDIVVYKVDDDVLLGRVIGREGDTIDGDKEGLLLNGSQISEEIFYTTNMLDSNIELPITLGKGEFFILNDYRENMNDSRYHGIITKDDLDGKVIFIFRGGEF